MTVGNGSQPQVGALFKQDLGVLEFHTRGLGRGCVNRSFYVRGPGRRCVNLARSAFFPQKRRGKPKTNFGSRPRL